MNLHKGSAVLGQEKNTEEHIFHYIYGRIIMSLKEQLQQFKRKKNEEEKSQSQCIWISFKGFIFKLEAIVYDMTGKDRFIISYFIELI